MKKSDKKIFINVMLALFISIVVINLYCSKTNEGFYQQLNNTDVIVEEEESINKTNNPLLHNNEIPYHKNENKTSKKGANLRIVPGKNIDVKTHKFGGVLNVYTPHIKK